MATSGDTGKGALEGFKDVPHTRIMVFYPKDGVSEIQELQMRTQEGDNVGVCSVVGNFDDAQTGVKQPVLRRGSCARSWTSGAISSPPPTPSTGAVSCRRSSTMSPPTADLLKAGADPGRASPSTSVCPPATSATFWPPTMPSDMGVPVDKLICASNSNNVLTDFLRTGVYDRNRPFYTTVSPSMDILISSNLERLLLRTAPARTTSWCATT